MDYQKRNIDLWVINGQWPVNKDIWIYENITYTRKYTTKNIYNCSFLINKLLVEKCIASLIRKTVSINRDLGKFLGQDKDLFCFQ